MQNRTEMGLLLIIVGMVLGIFASLGSLATGSLGGTNLSPGALVSGILGFFGSIVLLIGWIFMLMGRKEFGEEHAKFVMYSLILFIVGIIIVIVGVSISVFAGLAESMDNMDTVSTIDYAELARGMGRGAIFSGIGGIVVTVGAILLVYALENDFGKRILILALIVSIVISIISVIYLYSAFEELADRLEDTPPEDQEDEFYEGMGETDMIQGLGIISSLVLLIGYFIPYDRIKKGELKPIPPPSPYGMPPYGPGYPYQQPYPYQPYPQYPPSYQQPYPQQQGPPEGITLKTDDEMAQPEPSQPGAVQPVAVARGAVETMRCKFCSTQIPKESAICPVCGKGLGPSV